MPNLVYTNICKLSRLGSEKFVGEWTKRPTITRVGRREVEKPHRCCWATLRCSYRI